VPYAAGSTFDYFHAAGDLVIKYRGFSFFFEVLYRDSKVDNREKVDARGMAVTEWSRSAWGYFLQSGMMLGENFEAVARWGELRAVGDTDPALIEMIQDQGRELGGGLNLYLNGHRLKIQLDFFHLFGESIGDGRDVARLQLNVLI
jgi:hypothetical protein